MPAVTQKPWSIRMLHWAVAFCFLTAFATGYTAFDFDLRMSIETRDGLFAVHRLSGLMAAILLLIWAGCRLRLRTQLYASVKQLAVATFHVGFGLLCFAAPLAPWIARGLDGRTHELYSLLPAANLVSHPTTPLAYQLLQLHKDMVTIIAVLIIIHAGAAIYHALVIKDGLLRSMLFMK